MSADPATAFLALARAQRLLPTDELSSLARPGELTPDRLHELTDRLLAAGDLTPYQAQLLRAGRGDELVVAGFPVVGELGDDFRALHPSLGAPVVLRRLPVGRFPTDADRNEYVRRAQDASVIRHPHFTTLLDAGITPDGGVFVALEPFDGEDLLALVGDIGPMPVGLACDYLKGVAAALEVAAKHGTVHGDVQPRTLHVGPLVPMSKPRDDGTPRLRPTADATVKLSGLGLRLDLADDRPAHELAFAAPERLAGEPLTTAADVYGLGATLYYLLTGRTPVGHCETRAGLAAALRHGHVAPVDALCADVPPPLAGAIHAMLSADPARRPTLPDAIASLGGVPAAVPVPLNKPAANALADLIDDALASNVGLWTPAEPLPAPTLAPVPLVEHPLGRVESLEVLEGDPPLTPEEGFVPREYAPGESGEGAFAGVVTTPVEEHPDALVADAPPKAKVLVPRSQIWLWLGAGLGLQVLAVLLWVVYLYNPFADAKAPAPAPTPVKKPAK
jgi:serine/threonine protein kinase